MRLWIMSDLHLELTRGWDLPAQQPDFDVLVVAGDLITRAERGVRWLVERVSDHPVVYVAGNHESYGVDVDRTMEKAMEAARDTNVVVLADRAVAIGDTVFAGATLWTDFDLFGDRRRAMAVAGARMNDYRKIRINGYGDRFQPRHALARHHASRAFIDVELRKPRGDGKLVVVTHHAPVPGSAAAASHRFGEAPDDDTMLDAAYRSDLMALMSPQPAADGRAALRPADLWIHGHTHESFDRTVGATRIVSNAKGYGPWPPRELVWDNPSFDENLVIEI
jgi:predicted phosphodiesterase